MQAKIRKILKEAVYGGHPRIVAKKTTKEIFDVFVPERESFGHYSTNVALRLAKSERRDPLKLAQEFVTKIRKNSPAGFFEKIETVPPGFINFWLSPQTLCAELQKILKEKSKCGSSKIGKGKKIQVEFVSANPTGPLTLANGRGGFLGDVISNVLEKTGYKVEREYYVNDTGNQILTFGKSILALAGLIPFEEHFYKGEYLKGWANEHKRFVVKYTTNPLLLGQIAAGDFLKAIKNVLEKKARIRFNRWTSEEADIRSKKFTSKTLAIFERKKLAYKKDGAIWLKTTAFGDDKDRVLITKDGFPTYFLSDAGHYLETKKRGFNGKILILGPDHYGYVKRIQAAAQIVGLKNSEVLITQAIRLIRDGKEIKMSKRRGEFVSFEELVEEVGRDASRFFMLAVAPETHMDFDLKLAKEQSMKNPVYYAQYAYVRAASILKKIKNKNPRLRQGFGGQAKIKITDKNLKLLNTPADVRLMVKIARLPEIIEETARTYRVHEITRYATELAAAFHNFYEKERVLGEEEILAEARAELVLATAIVLKNLFDILGISVPHKM